MPPASQHGGESENVARKTREYFEEVAEVGEEEYLGCKILLLGSGGAGKTTLNLSLRGISQSHNPGSTHGILLEENPIADSSDGLTKTVHRTIWDFGGQELYHNTHTIFLKTNAVFVIVWNGEPNDFNINSQDPQNIQRPLRYWLDYIKIYGPKDPRIAVVRNWRRKKQANGQDEAEDRIPNESRNMIQHDFERATAGLSISCKLFIVNAFHKTSQYEDLRDWIDQNTISIARSQGTIIPATWHIAMMLIKPWIEADQPKDLSINEYSETLRSIFNCMKSDSHDLSHLIKRLGDRNPNQPVTASPQETIASWRAEYPLLYERIAEAEDFNLSDQRIRNALDFLHNTGTIFWRQEQLRDKVIVSQRWALRGIYTILSRESNVYSKLTEDCGVFTDALLEDQWKSESLAPSQKKSLTEYMVDAGACFPLISKSERPNNDGVYVSLAHLPSIAAIRMRSDSPSNFMRNHPPCEVFPNDLLHLGHWHAILRTLGGTYGREAKYATDGFILEIVGAQTVIVKVSIGVSGIGGRIELWVQHDNPETQRSIEDSMKALIARGLPNQDATLSSRSLNEGGPERMAAGDVQKTEKVFISYAWPKKRITALDSLLEKEYEESVKFVLGIANEIKIELESSGNGNRKLEIIFDRETEINKISEFVSLVSKSDKIIVIHSDKYWRSPWCVYEITKWIEEVGIGNLMDRTAMVKLSDCNVFHDKNEYLRHWERQDQSYQEKYGNVLSVGNSSKSLQCEPIPAAACVTDRNIYAKCLKARELLFGSWIGEIQNSNPGRRVQLEWSQQNLNKIKSMLSDFLRSDPANPKSNRHEHSIWRE